MGVVADNMKLGLHTVFFSGDESILAYTESKKIYINERTSDDVELINKHEVLHHYENSSYFKKSKKDIFRCFVYRKFRKIKK